MTEPNPTPFTLSNPDQDYIWVITDHSSPEAVPEPTPTGSRDDALRGNPLLPRDPIGLPTPPPGRVPVRVEQLEQSMTAFLQRLGRVFRQATQAAKDLGEMELDEIQLNIEINGEGQVSLLGTGGKAGGKGAIALTFKRISPVSNSTCVK